jgi:hypothetical protein
MVFLFRNSVFLMSGCACLFKIPLSQNVVACRAIRVGRSIIENLKRHVKNSAELAQNGRNFQKVLSE